MHITSEKELRSVAVVKTKYLLGLFGPDHMPNAGDQNKPDQPSLADMTDYSSY
jgi:alkaline phosphatase